jgi:hypothetical protein
MPLKEHEEEMLEVLGSRDLNDPLLCTMNHSFLALVRSHYLGLIKSGAVKAGSTDADVLLGSGTLSLTTSQKDLYDFQFIVPFIKRKFTAFGQAESVQANPNVSWTMQQGATFGVLPSPGEIEKLQNEASTLSRVIDSAAFNIAMVIAIIANAVIMIVEEELRGSSNEKDGIWLASDIVFAVVFTIEAALKLQVLRWKYFLEPSNIFDFVLVCLGIVGVVFNILAVGVADYSSEGRLVRVARVFRVLRLMRLFRLWRLIRGVYALLFGKEGLMFVQEHIQKMKVLMHFVRAHLEAQHEFIGLFGTLGKVDVPEVARPILQSQVSVYKAISLIICEEHMLGHEVLPKVNKIRDTKSLAEDLEGFVMEIYKSGVITSREANSVVHPVREYLKEQQRATDSVIAYAAKGVIARHTMEYPE